MAAKGSIRAIEYRMDDGREVRLQFSEVADGVLVRETFDAERIHA